MVTAPNIQFLTTTDGVSIAYTVAGEGPPLVCAPGWVSHQELEWQGQAGEFSRRLARARRLIMFDGRGTGLSDRRVDDVSLDARLKDLEAVVDQLQLDSFALFGSSQWSPVTIKYAAQHPDRVTELILYAPFCDGFVTSEEEDDRGDLARALLGLMRAEWGVGARAVTGFIHPDADLEEQRANLQYLRQASSGDIAARILEEGMFEVDVSKYVPQIQAPALVLHRRDDQAVALECGRRVASLLPEVRFLPLNGDHHMPQYGDTESILGAIDDFLGIEPIATASVSPTAAAAQSGAPVALLFTDMEGSTSLTERLGDAAAQELLRAHNDIVRQALAAHGGSEIKHTGDGIMASFPSASSALDSAAQIQRSIAKRNEEKPDEAIHVRIGINVGEPLREQDDLFGTAVQVARRICDAAEPGQILASNVVRELVAGKGFLFADMGETALRGFEDPMRVYELRWTE